MPLKNGRITIVDNAYHLRCSKKDSTENRQHYCLVFHAANNFLLFYLNNRYPFAVAMFVNYYLPA